MVEGMSLLLYMGHIGDFGTPFPSVQHVLDQNAGPQIAPNGTAISVRETLCEWLLLLKNMCVVLFNLVGRAGATHTVQRL